MQVIITTSRKRYGVPDCATEEEAMQRVAATHGVKPSEITLVEVIGELLPERLAANIPALYATEEVELYDKIAHVMLCHVASGWVWYVIEYDGQDQCFGYVIGHEAEFGYFSLAELDAIGKNDGLWPVVRNASFAPTRMAELLAV